MAGSLWKIACDPTLGSVPRTCLTVSEGEREVGAWQFVGAAERHCLARAILIEKARLARLLEQIGRDVLVHDDRLEIIGEQNALGPGASDKVHDSTLVSLIDEVRIRRLRRWPRNRSTPDGEPPECVERLQEIHLSAIEFIWHVGLDEGVDVIRVRW